MKRRSVTWSPVVRNISRPCSRRKRTRSAPSLFVLSLPDGQQKRVDGKVTAYARGTDTRSVVLTIRKNVHRDLQLLIDLPSQRIRRLYDGEASWSVSSAGKSFLIDAKISTVYWQDDRLTRQADAPGFRLDWLDGLTTVKVKGPQSRRHRATTRQRRRRSSRRRRTSRRR